MMLYEMSWMNVWWNVVMSIGWFTWFMAWINDVMIWVMIVYKFKFVNMILNMAWAMKQKRGWLPVVIEYGLSTVEPATCITLVVIEFGLTTVELASCITSMVIEFGLTTVKIDIMYNSDGDWVWSHYCGVGLTYNGKWGDGSRWWLSVVSLPWCWSHV